MSDNPFFSIREGSLPKAALDRTIFVDVGEKVIDSHVVRDGVDVGIFEIDRGRLDDIIGGRRPVAQRVVGQSIAAGTSVAEGTTIDLVLAPTRTFPAGVITGVLEVAAERELGELYEVLFENHLEEANRILRKVGPDDTLPPAEQELLIGIFQAENMDVGDDDVAGALETLRAAKTFGA